MMTCAAIIAIIFTINIALDIIFGTSIEYFCAAEDKRKGRGINPRPYKFRLALSE